MYECLRLILHHVEFLIRMALMYTLGTRGVHVVVKSVSFYGDSERERNITVY